MVSKLTRGINRVNKVTLAYCAQCKTANSVLIWKKEIREGIQWMRTTAKDI